MSEPIENPGEQLYSQLADYLANPQSQGGVDQGYFSNLDSIFSSEGKLLEAFRMSALSYALRRLIYQAKFAYRMLEEPPEDLVALEHIRKLVVSKLNIPRQLADRVAILLLEIVKENRGRRVGEKNHFRRQAKKSGMACYTCGKALDYEDQNSNQIEHRWPLDLGGSTVQSNLSMACAECNNLKDKFLNAFDYHFEHMQTFVDSNHEEFDAMVHKKFRMAVRLRSEGRCYICDRSASETTLVLTRLDPQDSWHFLNMAYVCLEHLESDPKEVV